MCDRLEEPVAILGPVEVVLMAVGCETKTENRTFDDGEELTGDLGLDTKKTLK